MRVLVTGCAGFAGSHICEHLLVAGHQVVGLDKLTYAARLDWFSGHKFVYHDLAESLHEEKLHEIEPVDVIVHNAAESHVSGSLLNPELTVRSNVIGTLNALEIARWMCPKRFIYVSTDEVFGPSPIPMETGHVLHPTNPYAATKASGEYLMHSYRRCFDVPTLATRTCNMFGPRQHKEKFVPLVIDKIQNDALFFAHTTQDGSIGKRSWCHVGEQARAITYLVEHGVPGQTYHVSAGDELSNLEMAQLIATIMGKELRYQLTVSDRPFYDECYRVQGPTEKPWASEDSLPELLRDTVEWYVSQL